MAGQAFLLKKMFGLQDARLRRAGRGTPQASRNDHLSWGNHGFWWHHAWKISNISITEAMNKELSTCWVLTIILFGSVPRNVDMLAGSAVGVYYKQWQRNMDHLTHSCTWDPDWYIDWNMWFSMVISVISILYLYLLMCVFWLFPFLFAICLFLWSLPWCVSVISPTDLLTVSLISYVSMCDLLWATAQLLW